jgi:hypothetical protein
MTTLVIHPQDSTTDFLTRIYDKKGYTVITKHIGKRLLKEAIKSHDRIMMMGHGCEKGLFDDNFNPIITSDFVYLLREKECVAIWCNADLFFLKYGLKGVYTGMIISDYMEANLYCVNGDYSDIEKSNVLFASAMTDFVETKDLIKLNETYVVDNDIIKFNSERIFKTS